MGYLVSLVGTTSEEWLTSRRNLELQILPKRDFLLRLISFVMTKHGNCKMPPNSESWGALISCEFERSKLKVLLKLDSNT